MIVATLAVLLSAACYLFARQHVGGTLSPTPEAYASADEELRESIIFSALLAYDAAGPAAGMGYRDDPDKYEEEMDQISGHTRTSTPSGEQR